MTRVINPFVFAGASVLDSPRWWLCPSRDDSANDISGNGFHGTYNGGMGTVADTGAGGSRAYLFDGSNDYIQSSAFTVSAPWTIGFWLKPASLAGASIPYCRKPGHLADSDQSIQLILTSTDLSGRAFDAVDTWVGRKDTSSTVTTGSWFFVVVTYDGGTTASSTQVFINAAQVDDTDDTNGTFATYNAGSLATTLGAQNVATTPGNHFNGRMDDIRVFEEVLTSALISEWYNSGSGRGY